MVEEVAPAVEHLHPDANLFRHRGGIVVLRIVVDRVLAGDHGVVRDLDVELPLVCPDEVLDVVAVGEVEEPRPVRLANLGSDEVEGGALDGPIVALGVDHAHERERVSAG